MDYLCRVCYENEGTLCIFNEEHGISTKIMYCCAKIIIVKGDGLPDKICSFCYEELVKTYEFVQKCERTDNKLREECFEIKYEPKNILEVEIKSEGIDGTGIQVESLKYSDSDEGLVSNYIPELSEKKNVRKRKLTRPRKKLKKNKGETFKLKKTKGETLKLKKTKSETFTCAVCGHVSMTKSALKIHLRKHNTETSYQCPDCDKKCKDAAALRYHTKVHHTTREKNFICEHCGKAFCTRREVRIHLRIHTGERPYSCPECSLKFTQMSAMLRHKKRHTGIKPHACPTCSKKFFVKDALKEHLKIHTDERNYQCTMCKSAFKCESYLKKHILKHTQPKSFVCNYCGKMFHTKSLLNIHISKMHSEKSGNCNICSKHVPNLEVHMWKHTGEKPLKCEMCPSSFSNKKGLAQHVYYRHKSHDKYKCTFAECTMTFPSRSTLSFHYNKVHENKMAFPCDQCSRGFYRKNDLAKHKLGTHKELLLD